MKPAVWEKLAYVGEADLRYKLGHVLIQMKKKEGTLVACDQVCVNIFII